MSLGSNIFTSLGSVKDQALSHGKLPEKRDLKWSEEAQQHRLMDSSKGIVNEARICWLMHTGEWPNHSEKELNKYINFDRPPQRMFYDMHIKFNQPNIADRGQKPAKMESLSRHWTQAILAWGLNVTRLDLYIIQLDVMPLWCKAKGYGGFTKVFVTDPYHEHRDLYRAAVYEQVEAKLAEVEPRWPSHNVPPHWRRCAMDWLLIQLHIAAQKGFQQNNFTESGVLTLKGQQVWAGMLKMKSKRIEAAQAVAPDNGFDAPDLDDPVLRSGPTARPSEHDSAASKSPPSGSADEVFDVSMSMADSSESSVDASNINGEDWKVGKGVDEHIPQSKEEGGEKPAEVKAESHDGEPKWRTSLFGGHVPKSERTVSTSMPTADLKQLPAADITSAGVRNDKRKQGDDGRPNTGIKRTRV